MYEVSRWAPVLLDILKPLIVVFAQFQLISVIPTLQPAWGYLPSPLHLSEQRLLELDLTRLHWRGIVQVLCSTDQVKFIRN